MDLMKMLEEISLKDLKEGRIEQYKSHIFIRFGLGGL